MLKEEGERSGSRSGGHYQRPTFSLTRPLSISQSPLSYACPSLPLIPTHPSLFPAFSRDVPIRPPHSILYRPRIHHPISHPSSGMSLILPPPSPTFPLPSSLPIIKPVYHLIHPLLSLLRPWELAFDKCTRHLPFFLPSFFFLLLLFLLTPPSPTSPSAFPPSIQGSATSLSHSPLTGPFFFRFPFASPSRLSVLPPPLSLSSLDPKYPHCVVT